VEATGHYWLALFETLRDQGYAVIEQNPLQVAAYRRSIPELTPALERQLRSLLAGSQQWVVTSSEALRGLDRMVRAMGPDCVAKLQRQQFIVPHARIEQTARSLGLPRVMLTGSGDEGVFAALQSQP
jgi:uroporphyrinogen-III synthase